MEDLLYWGWLIDAVRSARCGVIEDVDASEVHRFSASGDLDGVVSLGKLSGAKDDWEVVHAGGAVHGALAHSGIFVSEVSDL